jgi:hypothetical protein
LKGFGGSEMRSLPRQSWAFAGSSRYGPNARFWHFSAIGSHLSRRMNAERLLKEKRLKANKFYLPFSSHYIMLSSSHGKPAAAGPMPRAQF